MKRVIQSSISSRRHFLCPVAGSKQFRKPYSLTENEWERATETDRRLPTKKTVEKVLNQWGIRYNVQDRIWREQVGLCDFEFRQSYFVIERSEVLNEWKEE